MLKGILKILIVLLFIYNMVVNTLLINGTITNSCSNFAKIVNLQDIMVVIGLYLLVSKEEKSKLYEILLYFLSSIYVWNLLSTVISIPDHIYLDTILKICIIALFIFLLNLINQKLKRNVE